MMSTRHSVDARPFSHPARAEIRRGNIRECNLKRRNATLEAGNRSHSGELMKREDKKNCVRYELCCHIATSRLHLHRRTALR